MYCPACGKGVPDGSNFCLHCGSSMTAPKATSNRPVEWEQRDYVMTWAPGKGGRFNLTYQQNENTIRLENWNHDQSRILPQIQEWLDKGWEPITQVGPAAYSFRLHRPIFGGFDYLECAEFRVKMRRPKRDSR